MKTSKANARDKQYRKARYGMRVSNKSIFLFDFLSLNAKKRKKK